MVIVRLMGGLGNQMFQYAAGRRLALVRGVPLKLDISWFAGQADRAYVLHALKIAAEFATPDELRQIGDSSRNAVGRFLLRLRRFTTGRDWTSIHERTLSPVDRRVLDARGNTYLDGYWQSERYFGDVADTIRREFAIAVEPGARTREIAARIAATDSVSIHVRRGDYVADPRKRLARSVCTPAYYQRCVARVAQRVAAPHFFLFSDDPDWVAANLRLDHPSTVVSHGTGSGDHEDLKLMSTCRHHIIANSSFSWWAAWLNPDPDKLVLAPGRWMNDPRVDDRDVVPAGWIRL